VLSSSRVSIAGATRVRLRSPPLSVATLYSSLKVSSYGVAMSPGETVRQEKIERDENI
jgi:hypothetical protein